MDQCHKESIQEYLFKDKILLNEFPNFNFDIDNKNFINNSLGLVGMVIFMMLYLGKRGKSNTISRLISLSWIILGYKMYIEPNLNNLNNLFINKFTLFYGSSSLLIGAMLFMNFLDFYKIKDNWRLNSLYSNIKRVFNFIFLNYSYGVLDIDKIFLSDGLLLANWLNYLFIALNTFPLMMNFFIKKNLFNIATLYPSPVALATLTIFLNYFRAEIHIYSKYLIFLDILCYSFLIVNLLNDIFFLKIYSYENIFFLVLNILNLIFIYYFDIFELYQFKNGSNSGIKMEPISETAFYGSERLFIQYKPNGDGGIQGFYNREFFIDNFGIIANNFLIFSSKSLELIQDLAVRPVKLESNLLKFVYPIYS